MKTIAMLFACLLLLGNYARAQEASGLSPQYNLCTDFPEVAPHLCSEPAKAKRTDYALLFLVRDYSDDAWSPIHNAISAGLKLEALLKETYGFTTIVKENPTKEDIYNSLVEAQRLLKAGDQLFIYFSGHGDVDYDPVFKASTGYLVCHDSKGKDRSTYFAHDQLSKYIRSMTCQHILLVMDACYSATFSEIQGTRGPFSTQYKSTTAPNINQYIDESLKISPFWGYIASGRGRTAIGGNASPFTQSLIHALQNASKGYVLCTDITEYMKTAGLLDPPGYDYLPGANLNSNFFFQKKK